MKLRTALNIPVSLGLGHTHRKQSYTFKDALGKEISCYSLGRLGDRLAAPLNYMGSDNWSNPFKLFMP